ncbi:MAG: hypothetical protein R2733_22695 [Acidimicrobiales bacterium]
MARPDVRFDATRADRPSATSIPTFRFSEPSGDVIDLRDGPALTADEARAILGVTAEADWPTLRSACARHAQGGAGERRKVNTAYATLRLLTVE